jgi:hypothetical protein
MLQTEFPFTLPCGYIDEHGNLHREGVMRRSRTRDEVDLLEHPRTRTNEAYLMVLLLSRVIVRLGRLPSISPAIIEDLFSTDFVYLQELYIEVNSTEPRMIATQCPACGAHMTLDLSTVDDEVSERDQ